MDQIDIAVVSRRQIAALNRKYLKHAGPTDVLAFDLADADSHRLCGQIVVCGDIAAVEGKRRGNGVQRELMLYIVHGLLHLLAYDDGTPRAADRMRARQEKLLAAFDR